MTDQKLYFIALVPPEPIYGEALEWRKQFAEEYHSKAALRSPPHITLHMPFKWKEDQEDRIFEVLRPVASMQPAFDVSLQGFGAFKPRVIFIHVQESNGLSGLHDALKKQMKQSLNIFNAEYKDKGFHPHLTLAFRDLKKQMFFEAWKKFEKKEYEASFMVKELTLLKHNGKSWDIYKNFELKK